MFSRRRAWMIILALPVLAYAEKRASSSPATPWLTGPLLTPSAKVVPKGHYNFEPYIFVTETLGSYNSEWRTHSSQKLWSVNPQLLAWIGLTKKWDFFIAPQFFSNIKGDAWSTRWGDLPIGLDYQIHLEDPETWYPTVKLVIEEIFPTGKYQHGDPQKKGTDLVGSGSYVTSLGVLMSRLFHIYDVHFLATRWGVFYNIHTAVHVEGFNSYGGNLETKGKINPGNSLTALIGLEYSLTRNWALAADIEYVHNNNTHFGGKPGTTARIGSGSSEQFSIAPAIEYNWNESIGIIGGTWLTIAGRNSPEFISYVVALNVYK